MHNKKGISTTTIVTAIVIGLVVGGIGFTLVRGNKSYQASPNSSAAEMAAPTTDTKAADLRVLLNSLDKEHIALAANATRNGFDGRPDFEAAAKALDNNSVAIADAVGSVYGDQAKTQFLEIWRSHITFFVNYTVAAKKGDKAGMDKAVKDLGGYEDAISDFLSQANPNLPRDVVHQLISDHVTVLKSAVDAYAAGNYAQSYTQQHAAVEQVSKVADGLAGAIVKQKPELFK